MGTPDFAVPALSTLVENGYEVVAVITAPDKPAGRGRKLTGSPVKEYAVQHDLPVLQPTNLKDPEFLEELKSYNADLQIVVAFRMLPDLVWDMPPMGTFNLHGSLLPDYRGAAPINWAVVNGDKETGLTTFFLKHEIDTGDIIMQEKEPISKDDTAGSLYGRLMEKGAGLVLETVRKIEAGETTPHPQSLTGHERPAPKIFRETCEIDWSKPSEEIRNLVRGMAPYPAAWTTLEGKSCKIFSLEPSDTPLAEGKDIESDNKTYLRFRTGDGQIDIKELQLQGKRRMTIEDFLRGFNLTV